MAYTDDITALSPDHLWKFDGNVGTDDVGAVTATMTGSVASTPICEDVTNCAQTNTIAGDRFSLVNTTTISNSNQSRKAVGGWFMVSKINLHPVRIYGEGNTNTFQFVMALGNNVMLEVIESGNFILQSFGIALVPNRPYHLFGLLSGSGYDNKIEFFIDGVSQGSVTMGDTELTLRTPAEFADPVGNVVVGGTTVLLQAPTNGSYNQWAAWSNKTLPTPTEIREELFEKGTLADIIITNQAGLDALADTVRGNSPCCIRVTGNGIIDLSADNVTFDPLASIHVQYTGTGTLNWTNTNGSSASIGSTISGGTLNFINPSTLTINGLIIGSEVRIYDNENIPSSNYGTELSGVETNGSVEYIYSHGGVVNTILIQVIKDGYEEIEQEFILNSSNQSLTLFPVIEENE